MVRQTRSDVATTAAILILGASLVYSGVSLLQMRQSWDGVGATQPLNFSELMGAAAAGAGIALLCWWVVALVCACVSGVAHAMGAHQLATFAGAWSPAFMSRLVAAVLGLNLLAAPVICAAAAPGADPLGSTDVVATAPVSAADVLPPPSSAPVEPRWIPRTAITDPGPVVRQPTRPDMPEAGCAPCDASPTREPEAEQDARKVVVLNGDSLWSIVAASMGPFVSDVDVALAWPQWYQANRTTIGEDPNLILPGQVLTAPPGH